MEVVYLSCADVAIMIGRKEATVRKWCREGKLKAYKLLGGQAWYIKKSDIDTFMHEPKGE